jgi:hypothetical protein
MARFNYKPSKPAALASVPFGIGMIVFALTAFWGEPGSEGAGGWFLAFWCVGVVAIVGFNLWAAFAKNGSVATFESDERPGR